MYYKYHSNTSHCSSCYEEDDDHYLFFISNIPHKQFKEIAKQFFKDNISSSRLRQIDCVELLEYMAKSNFGILIRSTRSMCSSVDQEVVDLNSVNYDQIIDIDTLQELNELISKNKRLEEIERYQRQYLSDLESGRKTIESLKAKFKELKDL